MVLDLPQAAPRAVRSSDGLKVGLLFAGPRGSPAVAALVDALAALGHRDGGSIALLCRYGEGQSGRLPALMRELMAEAPDVIVAVANEAVVQAASACSKIPIVSANADIDFVGLGLAKSLDKPDGNVTGVSIGAAEAAKLRIALLAKILPKLSKLTVLMHEGNPANARLLGFMEKASKPCGIELRPVMLSKPDDIEPVFLEVRSLGAQAVTSLQAPFFYFQRHALCDLCRQLRLPLALGEPFSVEAGALLEVSPDIIGAARASAHFVHRILKGARAGDLPIERQTTLQVVVNLDVARTLGLTIDPTISRGGVRYQVRSCEASDLET